MRTNPLHAHLKLVTLCGLLLGLGALAPACDDGGEGSGGTDGGDSGGGDGGNGGDGGGLDVPDLPPAGESLAIGFVTHTRAPNPGEPEEWHFWLTDEDCASWPESGGCEATEVAGEGFSCDVECAITPNQDFALWTDPDEPGSLWIGDLAGEAITNSRILAQNVETWQYGPETAVYSRAGTVYARDFAGGEERQIISILSGDGRNLPGGFHYAPSLGVVIANIPTSLSAADLREVSVDDPTDSRLLYHFVSGVEQTTGSYYQGQIPTAVSRDGRLIALFVNEKHSTSPCDPDAGQNTCEPEYGCFSDSRRCVSEQMLLRVINRDQVDLLSVPGAAHRCENDNECGEFHHCDLTNPDAANLGECVPGTRVIGPFPVSDRCGTDAGGGPNTDPGEYNEVLGDPHFRSDGALIFVGSNECAVGNIDVTNIVAIQPDLGEPELIVENPGESHGGPNCYNTVEEEWVPEECIIEVSHTRISPSGNTLVFVGSSVRAANDTEAWLIDAFGRGGKRDLTRDILTEIEDVQVFPR